MAMNGSGTRDTAWVLGISKDTVTAALNKLRASVHPINEAYLKKEQIAWIRDGCDENAEIYIERDYFRIEVYTIATEARSEYLNDILKTYSAE